MRDVGEFSPSCVVKETLFSQSLLSLHFSQEVHDPKLVEFLPYPALPEAPPLTHSASFIVVAVDTISSIFLGYHTLLSAGELPVICNEAKHEQHTHTLVRLTPVVPQQLHIDLLS